MCTNLVIVESPAKVHTIKQFLGEDFEVVASNGHVRDLPKSSLGIDVDNDFEPRYITIRGKGELLSGLRKEVKKADKIYLATDPDREGEAISWHLMAALNLSDKNVYRITFNEITESAVQESLENAREIDMDLVNAQQARRCLDRMVGYKISPLLWAKVKRGLSAGRVQSVALRIICDREDEINNFIPQEYWTLDAFLEVKGIKRPLVAKYYGKGSSKKEIQSKEELDRIVAELEGAEYKVTDIKKSERVKNPPLPFTTSTLQQEASKVLNFSTQKTMRIAQTLYEKGYISYLRTDSTRVSAEAEKMAAAYIGKEFSTEYRGKMDKSKKTGKKIQDAHEAIRPTEISRTPIEMEEELQKDELRLYKLIWKRFTASRMAPAVYEQTSIKIDAAGHRFTVAGSKVKFDGFMKVYQTIEDKADVAAVSGNLSQKTVLKFKNFDAKQHFTQPAPHYTEASLVRALEELGVGRPSTYAPTITTILGRRYITKESRNLYVTELGEVVNNMMKEAFPSIVDVNFTANMETLLDGVEEGQVKWKTIIENFYPDLESAVLEAEKQLESVKIADEVSEEVCEQCGRQMVFKYGPHGKFLACPGFPECRFTKPYLEKIGVTCPKCGKDIIARKTHKGRRYYGCMGYPDCDFMVWQRPIDKKCPKCGNVLVRKGNQKACVDETCGYVER